MLSNIHLSQEATRTFALREFDAVGLYSQALFPALWFSMYPSCSTLGLSGFYELSLPLLSREA